MHVVEMLEILWCVATTTAKPNCVEFSPGVIASVENLNSPVFILKLRIFPPGSTSLLGVLDNNIRSVGFDRLNLFISISYRYFQKHKQCREIKPVCVICNYKI